MPLILISSCSIRRNLILGDSFDVPGPEWLKEHAIFKTTLYPFYELGDFEYKENEGIGEFIMTSSHFIIMTENTVYDTFYYKIPFHPTLQTNDYYNYFTILYICNHALEQGEEQYTFYEWMYYEMSETYLQLDHQDIDKGTCIVLQNLNFFENEYKGVIYQQLG